MSVLLKKRKYITKEQYNTIKSTKEGALCSYCRKDNYGELIYYIVGNPIQLEDLSALIEDSET